jgi:hypothetical protein
MKTQEILKKLEFNTGVFPKQAVVEAMKQQEEITPYLLDILRWSTENIERVERRPNRMGHLYAIYLLAYFREPRAYPLIVDFFSIPGEITLDVTGDLVTEDLPRVLVSVSDGDTNPMLSMVKDEEANEFVRGAALVAFEVLFAQGMLSREEVSETYRGLFRGGLVREPGHVWGTLIACCCELYPDDLMSEIEQAYADDLVPLDFIDLEWVNEMLEQSKTSVLQETMDNPRHQLIGDVVEEMEWWACFDKPRKPKADRLAQFQPQSYSTVRRDQPKVGRNDPCPCGSGRKWKHCCGRKS